MYQIFFKGQALAQALYHREVVESLSLEVFKKYVDGYWGLWASECGGGELMVVLDDLSRFFQPS